MNKIKSQIKEPYEKPELTKEGHIKDITAVLVSK
jgi:hypothetical protein